MREQEFTKDCGSAKGAEQSVSYQKIKDMTSRSPAAMDVLARTEQEDLGEKSKRVRSIRRMRE